MININFCIGFIGLGIMGKPMAQNLLKAGYNLIVNDIDSQCMEEMALLGASTAGTPAEVALHCNIIFTMLPGDKEVKEVILGRNGVSDAVLPGTVLIDMSSVSPDISREISKCIFQRGAVMFDAPVSGGEPKAIDGTLSFMVGGPKEHFEKIRPILLKMGAAAVYVGESGSGCVAKLANQIIVNLNIAAMAEAFTLAVKCGVNPRKVYEAIRGGLAGSTVLDAKAPLIFNRKFEPGGKISINLKDIKNVMNQAHQSEVPLPLSSMLLEILQTMKVWGNESEDHCAIVKYYERMANIQVMGDIDE